MTDDLITDLGALRRCVRAQRDADIRFRRFLQHHLSWGNRKLDLTVRELALEVEDAIDCTRCGNCCRVLEVSLDPTDLKRLARHLGQPIAEVEARYAVTGTMAARSFADSPCAFLRGDQCDIYAARPRDCRDYPHLLRGDVRARLPWIFEQAEECPIVFNTLERLKHACGQ